MGFVEFTAAVRPEGVLGAVVSGTTTVYVPPVVFANEPRISALFAALNKTLSVVNATEALPAVVLDLK